MGVTAAEESHAARLAARADVADRTADADRALTGALRAAIVAALGPNPSDRARCALALAEAVSVLWTRFLAFDAADALWPDRDRVVVAAEDGAPLLAALDALTGRPALDGAAARGEGGAMLATPGRGLATAVGLALAERLLAARFGRSLVDHRTWVIASAEEVMAGAAHEAAALAAALRLAKLTVLVEAPRQSSDPAGQDEVPKRFSAYGWATKRVEADDPDQVAAALAYAVRSARPTLVLCATEPVPPTVGDGESTVAADTLRAWAEAGRRGARIRLAWRRRHQRSPQRDEFDRALAGRLPEAWRTALDAWKAQAAADRSVTATAEASRQALATLAAAIPELVEIRADGGHAIRPDANGAAAPSTAARVGPPVRVGARFQALAWAMGGLSLHGGLIPAATTPLSAADSLRPALRLAASLRRRVIHVLAEEGTDGGREADRAAGDHLAALRAIPNLFVFRPADPVEVAETWALAAARDDGPSVLAVSGALVPGLRANHTAENLSARGGYVLAEAEARREVTLIATGPEVAVALAARDLLAGHGIAAAVVSLPCFELFAAQDETWRALVLGGVLRVGIESGIAQGWERWLGLSGLFLGSESAGRGAMGEDSPRGAGVTPEGVAQAVLRRLS